MEEKKKGSVGLIVALIIFIIISLGLGCYIGYDKLLNTKVNNKTTKTETVDKTTKTETVDKTTKETTKDDTYQVLLLSPIRGTAVVYNGEVYANVYDSTPNIDYVYGDGKYQELVKTISTYKEYDFGDLKVSLNNNKTDWMKLNVTNVKYIYNNDYGQALSSESPKYGIIMINLDNTVSYISIKDLIEGNINPNKLDVSDIEKVTSEKNDTHLVKSDGTKISVNTLIK